MSSFKKLLGLGGEEDKSQSSSRQSSSAVSAEHSGTLSTAAKKASNLVPVTIAERDETQKDVTVCQQESEVRQSGTILMDTAFGIVAAVVTRSSYCLGSDATNALFCALFWIDASCITAALFLITDGHSWHHQYTAHCCAEVQGHLGGRQGSHDGG